MKKVLAIILAAVLVLSCNMTAFAEIKVDGTTYGSPYTFNGDAQYVSADASNDDLTVTGNVEGEPGFHSVLGTGGARRLLSKEKLPNLVVRVPFMPRITQVLQSKRMWKKAVIAMQFMQTRLQLK